MAKFKHGIFQIRVEKHDHHTSFFSDSRPAQQNLCVENLMKEGMYDFTQENTTKYEIII